MGLLDGQDYSGAGLLGLLGSLTGSKGIQGANNALNNWVGQTMNSPMFNLGMGMINGGTGLNNVGAGIQQSRAAQTQNQLNQTQLQMQRAYMQAMQQDPTQGLLSALLGGSSPQGAAPPQAQGPQGAQAPPNVAGQGAPTGGLMAPQQSQQQQPQQQPQPSGLLGGIDPTKLMAVASTMMGSPLPFRQKQGEGLMQVAQSEITNNPALIQQRELAKQQLALDYQALSPTARAALDGQQPSAPLNVADKAAISNYLTHAGMISHASMSGNLTFAGITPQQMAGLGLSGGTINPTAGTNTTYGAGGVTQSNIQGAPEAAARMKAAEEGAATAAEQANTLVPLHNTQGAVVANVPKGSANALVAASNGAFNLGLSPGAEETAKGQGQQATKANEGYQQEAETANTMLTQIATLKQDAQNFTPGPLASTRAQALRFLLGAGLIDNKQVQQLAGYESGEKVKVALQAMVTKQLGSREAAQVFGVMGKTIPGLDLSPQGLQSISAYLGGIARYQQARAGYAQSRFGNNDYQGVNNTRDDWIGKSNPMYYILGSADPNTAAQMLRSMGANKVTFARKWSDAIKAGFAPNQERSVAAADLDPSVAALLAASNKASATPNASPAPQTGNNQASPLDPSVAALLSASNQPVAQTSASPGSPITRALGLAGRAAAEGIAGLPVMAGNAGIAAGNLLNKYVLPGYRPQNQLQPIDLQGLLNKAGFPQPTGLLESGEDLIESGLIGGRTPTGVPESVPANFVSDARSALKQQALQSAQGAGYVVPPSTTNPTFMNRLMTGLAGKAKVQQEVLLRNQPVTEQLSARALGQNPDAPLTPEALNMIRSQADQAGYAPVRSFGAMKGDGTFNDAIDALTQKARGAGQSFPGLTSDTDQLEQKLSALKQPEFDSSHALDALSYLRDSANDAYGAGQSSVGKAYKGASKALEDLVERNLSSAQTAAQTAAKGAAPQQAPELASAAQNAATILKNFRDARTLMAKTYSVGKALTGDNGTVSAPKIGAQLAAGKPLTGDLRTIGQFATNFHKAARIPTESPENASPLDLYGSIIAAPETHGFSIGLPLTRNALRSYLISQKGQQRALIPPYVARKPNLGLLGSLGTLAGSRGLLSSP